MAKGPPSPEEVEWRTVALCCAPGLVLLLAAFCVGPMPAPEEEGQPRRLPEA